MIKVFFQSQRYKRVLLMKFIKIKFLKIGIIFKINVFENQQTRLPILLVNK